MDCMSRNCGRVARMFVNTEKSGLGGFTKQTAGGRIDGTMGQRIVKILAAWFMGRPRSTERLYSSSIKYVYTIELVEFTVCYTSESYTSYKFHSRCIHTYIYLFLSSPFFFFYNLLIKQIISCQIERVFFFFLIKHWRLKKFIFQLFKWNSFIRSEGDYQSEFL